MQSDVFATMLTSSYKEGKANVIQMKDFNVDVLEQFFRSLYDKYVCDSANDLLALADKYHIVG